MPTISYYGENSFTFLFFRALHEHDILRIILLRHLKQFGTGGNFEPMPQFPNNTGDDEIWLFPNFGKAHGFGEPDALVLIGKHSFWFEVETRVDFQHGRTALNHALLQLARFHYFHHALNNGVMARPGPGDPHVAIMGPTVRDNGDIKCGVLRVAGHPVLQQIRPRLTNSNPHYVLLSFHQVVGPGGGGQVFHQAIGNELLQCSNSINAAMVRCAEADDPDEDQLQIPPPLDVAKCWYMYWRGDVDRSFGGEPPDPLAQDDSGGYVFRK